MRAFSSQAPPQVQSTLAKLELCRTAPLGGHKYRCDPCDYECCVYNSCGDRHCPLCSGAKRADWLDSTFELLIPGITYFQVVFTLPDKLSSLALGNRREMYDLLFRSAWKTLRDVIADEQHFEAAAAMVLHTWNQKLEAHAHVHALVPGGGPSLQGDRCWIKSRRPNVPQCGGRYLCNSEELKSVFRTNFIAGLKRLHKSGKLKLTGEWSFLQSEAAFDDWLKPMEKQTWVAYIEPPPNENCPPELVAKYLARYLTGGPISDRRLVSDEDGFVTFQARVGDKIGGSKETIRVRIPGAEFVRRWCLHILPKGYTKTRRFGGYSNHHRKRYIAECRELLGSVAAVPAADLRCGRSVTEPHAADSSAEEDADDRGPCCPKCQARMQRIDFQRKPSWRIIMRGPHRPTWYLCRDG